MRRIVFALAATALLALGAASPAHAAGASLQPVQDRYEAGDIATFVGYVSPSAAGGWVDDAPYATFAVAATGPRVLLGTVAFEPAPRLGPRTLRVSLTALLPSQLAAGHYSLVICNERCAKGFGDLAGGTIHVGVDPPQPIVREWPPDEAEIVNLPSGAATIWPAPPAPTPSTPASVQPRAATTGATGVVPTFARATPPAPVDLPSHDASPVALALGGLLAAICTGMVLVALRES